MSLILDALKKLEQEKTSRRGRPRELGSAILQEKREHSSFQWRPMLLLGIAVTCTAVVTVLLMSLLAPSDKEPSVVAKAPRTGQTALTHAQPAALVDAQPSPVLSPAPEQLPAATISGGKPVPASSPYPASPEREPVASSIPELKVTGIAWQEEQDGRRAVVNGSLIREGGIVAGAQVKEILPDRVRFSVGGRLFDITNTIPFH